MDFFEEGLRDVWLYVMGCLKDVLLYLYVVYLKNTSFKRSGSSVRYNKFLKTLYLYFIRLTHAKSIIIASQMVTRIRTIGVKFVILLEVIILSSKDLVSG